MGGEGEVGGWVVVVVGGVGDSHWRTLSAF